VLTKIAELPAGGLHGPSALMGGAPPSMGALDSPGRRWPQGWDRSPCPHRWPSPSPRYRGGSVAGTTLGFPFWRSSLPWGDSRS